MREVLLNIVTSVTLIALGAAGGYLFCQHEAYRRCDEVLNSETITYDAGDLYYIATGDTLTNN